MSNNEKKYVQKALNKYEEKKYTKLEELKRLDRKTSSGATIFSSIFGSVWSLVFGFGMCTAMGVILPGWMALGIVVGLIAMVMMGLNYLIYKSLLKKGRAKYEAQILALSEEILNDK